MKLNKLDFHVEWTYGLSSMIKCLPAVNMDSTSPWYLGAHRTARQQQQSDHRSVPLLPFDRISIPIHQPSIVFFRLTLNAAERQEIHRSGLTQHPENGCMYNEHGASEVQIPPSSLAMGLGDGYVMYTTSQISLFKPNVVVFILPIHTSQIHQ